MPVVAFGRRTGATPLTATACVRIISLNSFFFLCSVFASSSALCPLGVLGFCIAPCAAGHPQPNPAPNNAISGSAAGPRSLLLPSAAIGTRFGNSVEQVVGVSSGIRGARERSCLLRAIATCQLYAAGSTRLSFQFG